MIRKGTFTLLLLLLAVVALALRLVGLEWDQGLYLHPDERFVVWVTTDLRWPATVAEYFDTTLSPLNTYNTEHSSFVYGTFPSFLVKAIATPLDMDVYGELHLVGRATNAVFDTGTVVLTALLGKRFFGARAGLLAGVLLAFTPLFLQSAHFFTVDTIATFFAVAAFACALRSWDRHSIAWMALAGVMVGLAGASKPNFLITIAFLALPVLEQVRAGGFRSLMPRRGQRVYPALAAAFTGGAMAFVAFRLAMPYAFAGPHWWNISLNKVWLDDLGFWRAVQVGLVDMKPSIQWIDRTPVLYILQNMVLWGMGPLLGIASLVALVLAAVRLLRDRTWPSWWWLGIVGWCVANIALYGTGIAQNQRYLMQVYPFLIVLAAGLLMEMRARVSRQWFANLLTTAVVVYTVIFGIAFDSLYVRPITRIEASEWIYANLPAGSVISNEYWDDALPLPLPGEDRRVYTGMTLDLYGDESRDSGKANVLVGQLSQVDYIVLSSNRVIDSVVRQPERYPIAVRYYEMLLSGELGFEPVATFTRGPEFLGIDWDDRSAEESLTVYEHPQVRIFRKTDAWNAQHVFTELNEAWGYGGLHYIPGDPMPDQMLLSNDAISANAAADTGQRFAFAREHPLLSWWLAMQLVALAGWPLTWRAFRRLPDSGWMLAKGVGPIGMAAITLALVRYGPFDFTPRTILIALLLLFSLGMATERCVWQGFRYDVRRNWRRMLAGEAAFALVFASIALMRMHQAIMPDHNLMLLSGIMRSGTLPPLDPWLSGGILHTHWAGLLPWAGIGKVLTLDPEVTYNLTIVGSCAVLAGVIWSLLTSLMRSWLAVPAAVLVVWASTGGFAGGTAPLVTGTSVPLQTLALLPIMAVLLHTLMQRESTRLLPLAIVALVAGVLCVSAGWGLIAAAVLVVVGLAIPAWQRRSEADAWWPLVRRLVLETVAILIAGFILWYPAFAAYTPTQRNLIAPVAWSLADLGDSLGLLLALVTLVAAIGAAQVLRSTLTEGWAGIIAGGIAVGTVLTFAVLAWRLDSALMLVMLLSLLGVIAAWHWLHHPRMLWAMGMLMMGIGLLILAQARSFHALAGGESAAGQLLPAAWTLFVLALAIAATAVMSVITRQARYSLAFASVMVTFALLIPTVSQLVRDEWGTGRTSLASPQIMLSDGERNAALWIRADLTGMPVIVTAVGTSPGSAGALSAITGQPTVLGQSEPERHMRPGWSQLVDDRRADITTIYTQAGDWDTVSPLLRQHNVSYIVVGPTERAAYGIGIEQAFITAEQDGKLQRVYQSGGVSIYYVLENAGQERAPAQERANTS